MENKTLLEKIIYSDGLQVAFVDKEDSESYPEWVTGKELVVFGKKGVAISTKRSEEVRLIIINGEEKSETDTLSISGVIDIGNMGAEAGNYLSSDLSAISLSQGTYSIHVVLEYHDNTVLIYLRELSN